MASSGVVAGWGSVAVSARHRNGQFACKPVREAAPLCIAARKSEPHVRGAATKAARNRALVQAVAEKLRAEVAGRDAFSAWIGDFL